MPCTLRSNPFLPLAFSHGTGSWCATSYTTAAFVCAAKAYARGADPADPEIVASKDVNAMQPHIRAFVERAVTFTTCPECGGTRLNEAARSSKIENINIADACAMQITDLAEWIRALNEPSVAPLLTALGATLESFVE